jgi:hypothetical protein
VHALLGADHDKSPYTQTGERIARIAAGGVRLVVNELRTDVTKTRKDGSRGRLRLDDGESRDPQAAIAWLWKFVDGAREAQQIDLAQPQRVEERDDRLGYLGDGVLRRAVSRRRRPGRRRGRFRG